MRIRIRTAENKKEKRKMEQEDRLVSLIPHVYRQNNDPKSVGKKQIVIDVSYLKPSGTGARMEEHRPRGDRRCFKYHDVIICASKEVQLDLAEQVIQDHREKLNEKINEIKEDIKKKISEIKRKLSPRKQSSETEY